MTSLQNLTTQINDVLDGGRPGVDGDIGRVAATYAQLSAQANARLRRCVDLLRKGLRSEAVHEAETEPELFNFIQSLDLKRMQEWDRLCAEQGLDRPRPILVEGVTALNEAFAQERRLQPLLSQHRAAALRRAPLADRINILRRLREADPRNPVWPQDLRTLETARLVEIDTLLRAGNGPCDLAAANRLFQELVDTRWLVKPPRNHLVQARQVLTQAEHRWAHAQFRRLLPRLHEAHGAWDLDAAQRLAARWREVMEAASLSDGDLPQDLQTQWTPIAAWLNEQARQQETQRQFDTAAAELRGAMDRQAELPELQRLHESLRQFGQPIDEELEQAAQHRMASLRLAQQRRRRVRLAVIGAALLLVTAVAGAIAHDLLAQRFARRSVGTVASALRAGGLSEAETLRADVAGWRPMLLAEGTWSDALGDVDAQLQDARQQRARFAAIMEQIEEALPGAHSEAETASGPSPGAGAVPVSAALLDQADALAFDDAARQRVLDARGRFADHQARVQARRDAAMIERIERASQQLTAINQATIRAQPGDADAALAAIEAELAAIRAASQGRLEVRAAMVPVEAAAAALRPTVDHHLASARRQAAQAAALTSIGRLGGQPDALAESLRRYVERFPDSDQAADFARVAAFESAWRAVDQWTSLLEVWNRELRPATAADAATRLRQVQQYLEQHPASPLRSGGERYREYLAAVVLLAAEDGPWQSHVRELMATPVMTELNMVETLHGQRFYTVGDGGYRETSIGLHIDLALTPDLSQLTEQTFGPGAIEPPVPSPQKEMARTVLRMLRTVDVADAEANALRIVGVIIGDDAVDPILRALLVTLLADQAPQVSEALGDHLGEWVEPLRGFELDQAAWMDGRNADARALRAAVSAAIAQMQPLQKRIDLVLDRQAAMRSAAQFAVVGRGVLLEHDGTRVVEGLAASDVPGDAVLLALMRDIGRSAYGFIRVGVITDGAVKLDPSASTVIPQGSRIWAVQQ